MERVGGRLEKKIEGHCATGQSPQWAVVPMEEEEEEEEEIIDVIHFTASVKIAGKRCKKNYAYSYII